MDIDLETLCYIGAEIDYKSKDYLGHYNKKIKSFLKIKSLEKLILKNDIK